MTSAAIIVAAGSGERLGAGIPKALVEVAGIPLVRAAVERITQAGVTSVVVVAPPDHLRQVQAALGPADVLVVAGGATRSESVLLGLEALTGGSADPDVILVHDAARGFTPVTVIREVADAIRDDVIAAAPALAMADTLKQVDGDGTIARTVDRRGVVAVQTPQAFPAAILRAAHASGVDATDDLALVEMLIAEGQVVGRAVVTAGSHLAAKVTYPDDVRLLELLLAGSQ